MKNTKKGSEGTSKRKKAEESNQKTSKNLKLTRDIIRNLICLIRSPFLTFVIDFTFPHHHHHHFLNSFLFLSLSLSRSTLTSTSQRQISGTMQAQSYNEKRGLSRPASERPSSDAPTRPPTSSATGAETPATSYQYRHQPDTPLPPSTPEAPPLPILPDRPPPVASFARGH